ncbi:MAG: glycerophosphodiester phosphodiesterase [Clostridiaceae bacterium]|nr:glycerophosphodiester phosphodiesterase [Clostridiaceae bacterium]
MARTQIWAHRGSSAIQAENTIPAFEEAARVGADGIELDVQLTADGKLIVIHDEKTDRTTREQGWVHQLTADKLRSMNAAAFRKELPATKIPYLDEVIDLIKPTNMTMNIELKNGLIQAPGMEQMLWQLAQDMGMQERIFFSSFNHYSIRTLLELAPQAHCGLLYQCGIVDPWLYAGRVGAQAIHPYAGNLEIPNLISDCHKNGIAVHAWTINDIKKIKQAIQLGTDAIITDKPDLALKILNETPS